MSLGLGHRYWVRMIKHFYGSLEECIEFMKKNKPNNIEYWFELRPIVNCKTTPITCKEYCVDLVCDNKKEED